MADMKKATKQRNKALGKKQGALKAFTVAADEVTAANELLDESIKLHEAEIDTNAETIKSLIQKEDQLTAEILSMQSEKGRNVVLIQNLKQFSGK